MGFYCPWWRSQTFLRWHNARLRMYKGSRIITSWQYRDGWSLTTHYHSGSNSHNPKTEAMQCRQFFRPSVGIQDLQWDPKSWISFIGYRGIKSLQKNKTILQSHFWMQCSAVQFNTIARFALFVSLHILHILIHIFIRPWPSPSVCGYFIDQMRYFSKSWRLLILCRLIHYK